MNKENKNVSGGERERMYTNVEQILNKRIFRKIADIILTHNESFLCNTYKILVTFFSILFQIQVMR
jgi:hypothetical protein